MKQLDQSANPARFFFCIKRHQLVELCAFREAGFGPRDAPKPRENHGVFPENADVAYKNGFFFRGVIADSY